MCPVDLAQLKRNRLRPGETFTSRWTMAGREVGRTAWTLEPHGSFIRLRHTDIRWDGEEDQTEVVVPLVSTPQPIGNSRRQWFGCPKCLRACRILYARAGFRCRLCTRAIYSSQAESARWRPVVAAQKIRMRLGGDANLAEPFPYKPRTMHWAKYRKLEARYNRLVGCVTAGF
jgi:hypothetical protein